MAALPDLETENTKALMSNHYTPESEQNLGELVNKLKTSSSTHLRDLLSKMLNDADQQLLDMADNAAYSHEKDVFYWLKNKLKDKKPEVASDFMTEALKLLRPYGVTQAEEAAQKAEDLDDELSLVGQDDMEDIVLVKNVGTETAARFREQISNLETRLDHLALKSSDIFAKNALAPMKICQAFDDTLIEKFDLPERKALFELFKEHVADKLDGLYEDLNNIMIDAGILPQIKLSRGPRPSASPPPPPPADMPAEEGMHDEAGAQAYGDYGGDYGYGNYATGAAQGAYPTGAPGMPQGATGAPGGAPGMAQGAAGAPGGAPGMAQGAAGAPGVAPGMTQGAAGAPGVAPGMTQGAAGAPGGAPGSFPAGQTAAPGGTYGEAPPAAGMPGGSTGSGSYRGSQPPPDAQGVYQHQTAGMPASHVSSALGNYLGAPVKGDGANAAHSGEQVPSYPASTAQHFGHDEIINALTAIQANPQFAEASGLRFDAEEVKQAVMSAIAKTSGGIVTKRMNTIAEKTIDFIELVFDAIIDDTSISDTIKALLLRLQIPVIKASMIDQEFFIYDTHPARVLLDRISEVGMGVTEHSDEIYVRLDRIVNNLISEYELDTHTFQKALDKVNDFVREREETTKAREEEAQKQALRDHARNSVLKSLRNITSGKTLPEAIHALVLKRWPTLLFNHYLEAGKENDEWISLVEVLRDVIESVQPLKTAEDYAYLLAEKDKLIESVNKHLSKTYKSKKDVEQVVSGLVQTYDEMIADANFQTEEIEVAEQAVAEKPREKEPIEPEPAHAPKARLPSNVMPGMWFQISTGEGNTPRRCKLSVIIVEDEKLIFVTHEGDVVSEKSFEEFSGELSSGTSKVIMGHSVFDYALNSVITKLDPTVH
ncbi:MAG: DUF1631 family protein [Thiotrichales bacterium]|nr:MAG: DUF1631 family protein [Thiotrichales bacterium]